MIAKTTTERRAMAPAKIRALLVSIVNAIIIAPNTTKGERSNSLNVRFTPFCT